MHFTFEGARHFSSGKEQFYLKNVSLYLNFAKVTTAKGHYSKTTWHHGHCFGCCGLFRGLIVIQRFSYLCTYSVLAWVFQSTNQCTVSSHTENRNSNNPIWKTHQSWLRKLGTFYALFFLQILQQLFFQMCSFALLSYFPSDTKILLISLLSRNKQDTIHKLYMWHGSLAGNLTPVTMLLLCLVTFCAYMKLRPNLYLSEYWQMTGHKNRSEIMNNSPMPKYGHDIRLSAEVLIDDIRQLQE